MKLKRRKWHRWQTCIKKRKCCLFCYSNLFKLKFWRFRWYLDPSIQNLLLSWLGFFKVKALKYVQLEIVFRCKFCIASRRYETQQRSCSATPAWLWRHNREWGNHQSVGSKLQVDWIWQSINLRNRT